MAKQKLIPKVQSLSELYRLAARDDRYARLLIAAAQNLGGPDFTKLHFPISPKQQAIARQWLDTNANETSERGVVKEVNYCRDLI